MAKITARGDREVAREEIGGRTAVFTAKGRILYKWRPDATYNLIASGRTRSDFDKFVAGLSTPN